MILKNKLEIKEKPSFISWDKIHEALWYAHKDNREKGINMAIPTLSGDKIRDKIEEENGKMFVALEEDKVVATGAILIKKLSLWCGKDKYAYLCLGSVLPDYGRLGIYREMRLIRENEAMAKGINLIVFDTHEKNHRMLDISKKNGYIPIDIKVCKDHYNIIMVKWLKGCPYSDLYCKCQYLLRKCYRKIRYRPGGIKRLGI